MCQLEGTVVRDRGAGKGKELRLTELVPATQDADKFPSVAEHDYELFCAHTISYACARGLRDVLRAGRAAK